MFLQTYMAIHYLDKSGRIGALVTAKPVDRRAILEDAEYLDYM